MLFPDAYLVRAIAHHGLGDGQFIHSDDLPDKGFRCRDCVFGRKQLEIEGVFFQVDTRC
jgi:hypothetical protein